MKDNYIQWCIEKHQETNHLYDGYLPYQFHLRMVAKVAKDFEHLLSPNVFVDRFANTEHDITALVVQKACWGHDLIEDARCSYNDVRDGLGKETAEIVYALTNEKGKSRKERANDKYYAGIRKTTCASFVKLCDRIANVQYGRMTGSKMFDMYKKENEHFMEQIGNVYPEMTNYLKNLFEKR